MKYSLNWLKDHVPLTASDEEITHAITFLGFEVEGIVKTGAPKLDLVVVGEVLTREKHPNADKLSVCTVDLGTAIGVKTIVCGAQNYRVGDRVPVALPGAVLPGNFAIKQSKIRGQTSDGMMCAADEIGVAAESDGLLLLPGKPALGTPINEVLPPGDTVFDVEITPNRPDCLSHVGLARELAARFKLPLHLPALKFRGKPDGSERRDLLAEVRVDSPEDCPLYTAHVIAGVRIGPSPEWLQERLRAVGLRPINNVVDAGNYVMLETGQPLHAFDARKLGGKQIVVRRAAAGEKIVTLDGKERTLTDRMLVIADATAPVVIAGLMGGENSGVAPDTTDLVVECAVFRRQSIRATSRQLALASDSSYRYERGVDSHSALAAAWRAVDLIVEVAGGQPVGPVFHVGSDVTWEREIAITQRFIRDRLGFEIPAPDIRASFEALRLQVTREEKAADGLSWTVAIPSWRDDLDRSIDLVEEVLRLYGTDRIPPARVVSTALVRDDDPVVRFNRRVSEYLIGHDFHECVNYTLRPAREIGAWVSGAAATELALSNPFVEDQSHLRPTLVTGLLENLKLNQSRGVPAARLFESGRVFLQRGGQNVECAAVAFIVAEDTERRWKRREPADFYSTRHHVGALAAAAGIKLSAAQLAAVDETCLGWQKGHAAMAGDGGALRRAQGAAADGGGWTARCGLLDVGLVKSAGIEGKVWGGLFTITPERLAVERGRVRYSELSSFPPALRDIALVVDRSASAEEIRAKLTKLASEAAGSGFPVENVAIFDVFEGGGLPVGKKSLAFSLTYRSADRTLTDAEVNAAFTRLQESLGRETDFQVRK